MPVAHAHGSLAAVASALAVLVGANGMVQGAEAPHRVASLNLCTDELVLRLAPPGRIASVTWLSQSRDANLAELANKVKANHGLAEEIIPLDPDLVVAGAFTTRTAVALLKQVGQRVVEFGVANDIGEVREQIAQMADLVGEKARGDEVISQLDRRLGAETAKVGIRPLRALVLNANGFTVGTHSLVNDILVHAGLENVAGSLNLGNYQQVPLEVVVDQAVDMLIVSTAGGGPPSLATEILNHPVLSQLPPSTHVVLLPTRLWTCAGPQVVDAVAQLRAAADVIRAGR